MRDCGSRQKLDSQGIPWMAIVPTLVGLLMLLHPALAVRRLSSRGLGANDSWSVRLSFGLAIALLLSITPSSYADMGWVVLPTAFASVSFVYLFVFRMLMRMCEEYRVSPGVFAGFVLPMVLLSGVLTWGAWGQYAASLHDERLAFAMMRDAAMVNFLLLGVLPPTVASLGITLSWLGSSRAELSDTEVAS